MFTLSIMYNNPTIDNFVVIETFDERAVEIDI